jgi:hypothetical protein
MTTIDISRATATGDLFEHEGHTYRVRIEPETGTVQDFWSDDCYGKISEYAYDYGREHKTPRPATMDGRAVKIQVDRGYWMWWQAPDDIVPNTPEWIEQRTFVRTLLEFGFWAMVVERLEGTDAYGRSIVTAFASLGGIDSIDSEEYLNEMVAELLAEIND